MHRIHCFWISLVAASLIAGCGESAPVGCRPGETRTAADACQAAGVPQEACAPGFEPDGQAGCFPVLPDPPCQKGQIAVPGDTQCHEVAPCLEGEYGSIPGQEDPTTEFVNGAYQGNDSVGTREKPWRSIQQGIDHAKSGAIVAVAAGSYEEDLQISHRPVKLWGKCPAMVEVVGKGEKLATIEILSTNTAGSEIHTIAITGPGGGVGVAGPDGVLVDRAWVHGTAQRGFNIEGSIGPTSVTIRSSLVEQATEYGLRIVAAEVTIEGAAVRDTRALDEGSNGFGIDIESVVMTIKRRSSVTVRSSLLERNTTVGLLVVGADAAVEGTVVRDTQASADGASGIGVDIQADHDPDQRANVVVRGSLVDQNREAGIVVQGSDATIEATVVRATQPNGQGVGGRGIEIHEDPLTNDPSSVTLRASLVERNHQVGVFIGGSEAAIEGTIVRSTLPDSDGESGGGIALSANPSTKRRAAAHLAGSILEENHGFGVNASGSDVTMNTTIVRSTRTDSDGRFGRGVEVQPDDLTTEGATLSVSRSIIEDNHEAGVVIIASSAAIEASIVRRTRPDGEGQFGDGVLVASNEGDAKAELRTTVISENARAGVANFGAAVLLSRSFVICNLIDIDGEDETPEKPFRFDGSKDNLFGCGSSTTTTLVALSYLLNPLEAIPPTRPQKGQP